MTPASSSPSDRDPGRPGGEATPQPVGWVELTATFPLYGDEEWHEGGSAEDVLDILIDDGLHGVTDEATEYGSTKLTVSYRGDEATQRSPM